jgi:hypothetical protein
MKYGNEGARQIGRCSLPQIEETAIKNFLQEINRVLTPSGHLFLWIDKFHLCEGISTWFKSTDLNIVDLIVWDKGKIGMGYRSRRKSEYLLVLQKSTYKSQKSGVFTCFSKNKNINLLQNNEESDHSDKDLNVPHTFCMLNFLCLGEEKYLTNNYL